MSFNMDSPTADDILKILLAAHSTYSRKNDANLDDDFGELVRSLCPEKDDLACEDSIWLFMRDRWNLSGMPPHLDASPDTLHLIRQALLDEFAKRDLQIKTLEADKAKLESRLSEMHGFDVKRLGDNIVDLEQGLSNIEQIIGGNPQLQPLAQSIAPMKSSVASLKVVTRGMDDVYKVIIKPIQEEGKSGIKATVKWAIASIALSTFFSVLVSWFFASRG